MGAWDVVRFSEYHRYQCVVVENVVEFTQWELYEDWLNVMLKLGYEHQVVCFNSQFAYPVPVPQSRDRKNGSEIAEGAADTLEEAQGDCDRRIQIELDVVEEPNDDQKLLSL